jgi:uncharacterized protein YbaR (Trm112 family)
MKNVKFVNNIVCPYCEQPALKLIPLDNSFEEYHTDSVFCTECGRHSVNLLTPPKQKEAA